MPALALHCRRVLAWLTLWLVCPLALAMHTQPLRLGQDIGWSLLHDDSGVLTVQDVAATPAQRFVSQAGAAAVGLYRGALWLRFEVPAHWNPQQELWLQVTPSFLDSVRLYRPVPADGAPRWRVTENGDTLPHAQREFDHSTLVFRIQPDERGTLLLRVQTSSTLVVHATLHTPQSFSAASDRSFALFGLYTGISLVTVTLLLTAGWLRSRPLVAVGIAWLVSWLQQCASRGLMAQYLFPASHGLANDVMSVLTSAAMATSIWVVREEFTREGPARGIDRLLVGLALVTLLSPLGIPLNVYGPLIWLAYYINVFALGLGVMVSLRSVKTRTASSLVSAMALGVSLLIMVLANLAALGLLPYGEVLLTVWSATNPLALAIVAVAKLHDIRGTYARWREQQVRALQDALVEGRTLQQGLRDRTAELLRTQATLRHALNAEHRLLLEQRQFFAMISHEFRTPLTVIDNLAATQVRFPSQDEAVQVRRARQIRGATHRLSSLVNNCLVDERLSAGGFVLQAEEVSVSTLVVEATDLVLLNEQQRMQIDASAAPERWPCDPTLLRIAISNLVDNAAKYSRRGCIRVAALQVESDLLISVSDDGPGIQAADRARIFQAFERGRHGDEGGGFGFGLYVTRKIARLHGGDVTMVNSFLGGSVFHLSIPRRPSSLVRPA